MSQRIDPDTAVTVTVGIRLPTALLELLDAEVDRVTASAPGTQATRASVARALLTTALQERATTQLEPTSKTASKAVTASSSTKTQNKQPSEPLLRDLVLAILQEQTPTSKAKSILLAPVVRELVSKGHEQAAIHRELVALDHKGTIELRPESGAGLLSKSDAALCPQGPTGVLSTAVWR